MKGRSCEGTRIHLSPDGRLWPAFANAPEGAFAWGRRQQPDGEVVDVLYAIPPYDNAMLHGFPVTRDRKRQDKSGESGTFWWWDGDRGKPTLEPSIGASAPAPYAWHGYLRGGRWEACE